jgi:cytochrome c-type biogenesis protein CcmE
LVAAGVVIVGALGFLLWQGLDSATVYFKTADEAVRERADLGGRRFRVEGRVVEGTLQQGANGARFSIEENGATVDVVHQGDPPELFREGMPVVLEGRWRGDRYESDRILVKHSEEYKVENPDRVQDYSPTTR